MFRRRSHTLSLILVGSERDRIEQTYHDGKGADEA